MTCKKGNPIYAMTKKKITLKEMQRIELDMLLELQQICENHKLRYYIDGGTLLGAFCYGGFIPWDDDIDVKMPRPDYDQLVKYRSEFSPHIQLVRPEEDGFRYSFTKLMDNRTILIENPGKKNEHRGGVYVDILPMDGHQIGCMRKLERYKTLYHISKSGFPDTIKGRIYSVLYHPESVYKRMTKLARQCDYDQAEYVGLLIDGDAEKERFTRKSLDHCVKLSFEGHHFPASSEYREHLVKFYGEHVLQSEGKGNLPRYPSGHQYEVYWKE